MRKLLAFEGAPSWSKLPGLVCFTFVVELKG
jgi:hypothetical protein